MKALLGLFAVACVAALAQKSPERSVQAESYHNYISTIADGGYWKTTFIIVNLDKDKAVSYTLKFFGNNGSALSLPIAGRGRTTILAGALDKGQTAIFETEGTAPTLTDGWAKFEGSSNDKVGAMALYGTVNVPNRPDFEAVVPAEYGLDSDLRLPFDNTNGAITSFAWVNPADYQENVVDVTVYDESGAVLVTESVTIPKGARQAFASTERFPASRGRRGTIRVTSPRLRYLTLMGLRFNKSGGFTSIHCLSRD